MQFGNLKSVALRKAWPHEVQDFTPWLAENLEMLSKVIGIDLELEDKEVNVEGFSADILARNPTDDSLVLIENQLENSDHTHLGQILTYHAGLKSQTVIWIARDFSPAHLSAIRWLNEHTADPFAFFAVQVKVVRIENSPMAPVFEIRERPQWNIQPETLSNLARFRRDFWVFYSKRFPSEFELRPGYHSSNLYHKVEEVGVQISQYLAPSSNQVGVYLSAREPTEVVRQRLQPYESRFREEFGVTLDRGSHHFGGEVLSINPLNPDNWPTVADWFHKMLVAYRRVLTATVD